MSASPLDCPLDSWFDEFQANFSGEILFLKGRKANYQMSALL